MAIEQMLGMGNVFQAFNPISKITNAFQGIGNMVKGVLSLDPGAVTQGLTQTLTGQDPNAGLGGLGMGAMGGMDLDDEDGGIGGMGSGANMGASRSANALLQREIQKLNLQS